MKPTADICRAKITSAAQWDYYFRNRKIHCAISCLNSFRKNLNNLYLVLTKLSRWYTVQSAFVLPVHGLKFSRCKNGRQIWFDSSEKKTNLLNNLTFSLFLGNNTAARQEKAGTVKMPTTCENIGTVICWKAFLLLFLLHFIVSHEGQHICSFLEQKKEREFEIKSYKLYYRNGPVVRIISVSRSFNMQMNMILFHLSFVTREPHNNFF